MHYDPSKPVTFTCDVFPHGIGTVLAYRGQDGQERLIAFATQSLAPAEGNYGQLDKEVLALIYGMERFHQYLWGTLLIPLQTTSNFFVSWLPIKEFQFMHLCA